MATANNNCNMQLNPFQLIANIPQFDGKPEDLQVFISNVDTIRLRVAAENLDVFDLNIRNKCVGKANITLVNNNNPTRWENIKVILRVNFNISDSIESIVNRIKTAELRTTICDFYEYMYSLLTKLNLKTSIDPDNAQWYSSGNNDKMVLKIFISKLPNEPKLILNSRNPTKFLNAKEILIETEYFYTKNQPFLQSFSSKFNNQNRNLDKRVNRVNNFQDFNSVPYNQINPGYLRRNNYDNRRNSGNFDNGFHLNNNWNFNNNGYGNYSGNNNSGHFNNESRTFNGGNLYNNGNGNNGGNFNNGNGFNRANLNYSGYGNNSGHFLNQVRNYNGNGNGNNSTQFNTGNSGQTTINRAVPMDVDTIQVSNFQLPVQPHYPV